MEDRYLFKAKRVDNGKWVVWNIFSGLYGADIDRYTVRQCTGLKDKNGKLIWENDIVKYRVYQHTEQLYKVIYDYEEGSWSLGCNSEPLYSIGRANSEKCEVVGNAFDNPELLEV